MELLLCLNPSFRAEYNSRRGLECISASADKNQHSSTVKLSERAHEILRWKTEVERAIEAMVEEINNLEQQQKRANNSKSVLGMIKSISSECMARRAQREGHELARDNVEEELIKVLSLTYNIVQFIHKEIIDINLKCILGGSISE